MTAAQSVDVTITVNSLTPPRVRVEGVRDTATKNWSFLNAYAGITGLAARIENLSVSDAEGKNIPVRLVAVGEHRAEGDANRFVYDVNLEPPTGNDAAPHVSWLTGEQGLLLLADLLPRPLSRAKVKLVLPDGWSFTSNEAVNEARQLDVADADNSVILIGRNLRTAGRRKGSMETAFFTTGEWAFSDDDFASTAGDILRDYEKILGGVPRKRAAVLLIPFPRGASAQTWGAETRGGTVILLSGRWPSKTFALSRLDNILSHELLHLWVPNGLSLEGEYGWFYEGFTLYLALRSGLRRGQLTFQDFLNAIGRANDAYKSSAGKQEVSLMEASRKRWNISAAQIYDKGMLVAFLYDLMLLKGTRGQDSLEDAYREVFSRYRSVAASADGNRAVAQTLKSFRQVESVVSRYVEGTDVIDLRTELGESGLRLDAAPGRTRIAVAETLTKQQGELLRQLGYNAKDAAAGRRLRERLKN